MKHNNKILDTGSDIANGFATFFKYVYESSCQIVAVSRDPDVENVNTLPLNEVSFKEYRDAIKKLKPKKI